MKKSDNQFTVYDVEAHAQMCPPSDYGKALVRRIFDSGAATKRWSVPKTAHDAMLRTLSRVMHEWLDTLPEGAFVSGAQVGQAFDSELMDNQDFRLIWLKILYEQRRLGLMEGYFSKAGTNKWGKPFVNYHCSRGGGNHMQQEKPDDRPIHLPGVGLEGALHGLGPQA